MEPYRMISEPSWIPFMRTIRAVGGLAFLYTEIDAPAQWERLKRDAIDSGATAYFVWIDRKGVIA